MIPLMSNKYICVYNMYLETNCINEMKKRIQALLKVIWLKTTQKKITFLWLGRLLFSFLVFSVMCLHKHYIIYFASLITFGTFVSVRALTNDTHLYTEMLLNKTIMTWWKQKNWKNKSICCGWNEFFICNIEFYKNSRYVINCKRMNGKWYSRIIYLTKYRMSWQ